MPQRCLFVLAVARCAASSPCDASFIWRTGRRWGGGFEAFIDISGVGVRSGHVVAADFRTQGQGLELLKAEGAAQLSFEAGLLLLQPTLTDGRGTLTLRFRGSLALPQLRCIEAPPTPPPPPSPCTLGAAWDGAAEVIVEGSTYGATLRLRQWVPGTLVGVALGAGRQVTSVSAAAVLEDTATLRLLEQPPPAKRRGGAGFVVRLVYSGEDASRTAFISCVTPASYVAPPTPPSPPPWCGLRATYHVLDRKDDDRGRHGRDPPLFEAEVALEAWEAGAEVSLDFAPTPFQVVSVWFAKQTFYSSTSSSFELAQLAAPPMKVKLTARGNADAVPQVSCTCSLLSPPRPPPLPPRPPPPPPGRPSRPPPPPPPNSPPYEPQPGQPQPPRATATSCHTVSLAWSPPPLGSEGLPVLECAIA